MTINSRNLYSVCILRKLKKRFEKEGSNVSLESTTDTFVAIIGSGIIGRIAARKFSELKIPNILISPASEIVYKVKHLDGGFPSKKIYIPSLGHSSMWGNQHDINFADFWQPPAFSDLPGFPLQPGDIFDEIQDLNRYLGVSITAKSVKSSSFEQSLGVQRFHLKGQRSILKRRFPLENFNHVEFEVDSIHIRINSEKGAQITYTNLDGDEKTVHSRYLVLSAGGLGNLEIMDRLYRDNKMEIPKTLGMGYVNHPKAITHYLKLRRYSRVNIQSTSLFKSWSKFQVFDMQLDSSDVRQPRISVRFWEMPIAEFSQSIGTTTKVLEKILDSILRKMGWHRYLKVMVYFESAQLTTSYLNVQSRGQEVKISQKIGNFEC